MRLPVRIASGRKEPAAPVTLEPGLQRAADALRRWVMPPVIEAALVALRALRAACYGDTEVGFLHCQSSVASNRSAVLMNDGSSRARENKVTFF